MLTLASPYVRTHNQGTSWAIYSLYLILNCLAVSTADAGLMRVRGILLATCNFSSFFSSRCSIQYRWNLQIVKKEVWSFVLSCVLMNEVIWKGVDFVLVPFVFVAELFYFTCSDSELSQFFVGCNRSYAFAWRLVMANFSESLKWTCLWGTGMYMCVHVCVHVCIYACM